MIEQSFNRMDIIKNAEEWKCPYPFITTKFLTKKEIEFITVSLTDKTTDVYSEFDRYNLIEQEDGEDQSEEKEQDSFEESDSDEYDLFGDIQASEEDSIDDYFDLMGAESSFSLCNEDEEEEDYEDDIIDIEDVTSVIGVHASTENYEESEHGDDMEFREDEKSDGTKRSDLKITLDSIFENSMNVKVTYGEEILGDIKLEMRYLRVLNSFFTREWKLCIDESTEEIINADFVRENILRL